MKSIKLLILCIGLTIGQFSFSSNYMQLLNDNAHSSQATADTLTKESFISPEMQWAVVSFNKPESFIIDKKTGAVLNMPSTESLLSSINLQIHNGNVSDEQKESMLAALRAMLEATEIALSTLPIQAAYEYANAGQFTTSSANFAKDKILQDLNQQKTNIQLTQSRVNAINPKSYVSWMFGSSSTNAPTKPSGINLQPVPFDSNASTISIPAHLMDSIIKLNDYKQKPDVTIAANLLFKQCFIAQQQHRANPIEINLNNPFNAENYIYNNFPAIYSKFNNKYPICELAQQQGRQARIPLLHIRQAIQTALAIANKKSTSNLGSFLPQYLTSYLDGVVSELMKYDNYVGELCKNPQYGATAHDIAQSAEWSTMSKVAAGVAIVGVAAGAYYFRNEIGDAGKQTYDQATETAHWLTGKTAQNDKEAAEDKAAADQKILDDQKAIAFKIASERAEQERIAQEKENARLAQEEEERITEEEIAASNSKYLNDKVDMLKDKANSFMQTIKENMPFVSNKVAEQEQEKQDQIEKNAPIAAEQMKYAQENAGPILKAIQEKSAPTIETLEKNAAPFIDPIKDKVTRDTYTFGAAGLKHATNRSIEPGINEYVQDRQDAEEEALIKAQKIKDESPLYKAAYNAAGFTYQNKAEQTKKDLDAAKIKKLEAEREAQKQLKLLQIEQDKLDEAQEKAAILEKQIKIEQERLQQKENIARIKSSGRTYVEYSSGVRFPEEVEAREIKMNLQKLQNNRRSVDITVNNLTDNVSGQGKITADKIKTLTLAEQNAKNAEQQAFEARRLALIAQDVEKETQKNLDQKQKDESKKAQDEIDRLEALLQPSLSESLQQKYKEMQRALNAGTMTTGNKGLDAYNKANELEHGVDYIGEQEAAEIKAAYDNSLEGMVGNTTGWVRSQIPNVSSLNAKTMPTNTSNQSLNQSDAEQAYQDFGVDLN